MRHPIYAAFVICSAILAAVPAFAEPSVVETCVAKFKLDEQIKTLSIKIVRSESGQLTAVSLDDLGQVESDVDVQTLSVRPNLRPGEFTADYNPAELLMTHALTIEATPDLKDVMSSGVDLAAVRSATIYLINPKADQIGMPAIVTARDGEGRPLGKFFGGLLLGPCE